MAFDLTCFTTRQANSSAFHSLIGRSAFPLAPAGGTGHQAHALVAVWAKPPSMLFRMAGWLTRNWMRSKQMFFFAAAPEAPSSS